MIEQLDTVISLLKSTNPSAELDNIAKLAKAYHLLSDLESLQNPFIKLIKERVNQQYEAIRNHSFEPKLAVAEEPVEKSKVVLDLQQTIDQYSRDEIRNDICNVVHQAQRSISIKEIHDKLSDKYGTQDTTRALISQLSSQLASWSWHAAHWWRPDYLSRAIYKAGNQCIAASAPNIDRSVFYVRWSPLGYIAKIRSYLSNFKKNANHINGIKLGCLLKLADVDMSVEQFTKMFNDSQLCFMVVDGALYHRNVVIEFKVDYNQDTKLYSAQYHHGSLQHFETPNSSNLVTYLFSSFAFLSQQGQYHAAVITGNPQFMPDDVSALIANGITLKSKRTISKLPEP